MANDASFPKSDPISPLNKGLGPLTQPLFASDTTATGWNLLREDISLPAAVLDQAALQHNLAWMQQFIAAYGLKLAPHGKTTMAPKLFGMQLRHGAWGITLATAQQSLVAHRHGVRRVLMANQLVGKQNMAIVSRLLQDEEFEFFCLVDSAEQVQQLGTFFAAAAQRLNVLIEIGVSGGRAGIRNQTQLTQLLDALAQWDSSLALCGIEVYEGVLHNEQDIRELLAYVVETTRTLLAQRRFARSPVLLSGAGSAWYDVVASVFADAAFDQPVEIVLRPGCYLTHDVGIYREAQALILKRNPIAQRMHSGLVPALRIWACVQSVPEPHMAVIAMGKRDAAFDAGLPVPALRFRPGTPSPRPTPSHWLVSRMMDQHAYLNVSPTDDLRVGDIIGFDVSHPCLTFDKWRSLLVVDENYDVVDVIATYF